MLLLFALLCAGGGLSADRPETDPSGLSASAVPLPSAVLSKKDTARAVLLAERRPPAKSRWSDPNDALPMADVRLQRDAFDQGLRPSGASLRRPPSTSLVFQARAPPSQAG